MYPPCKKKKLNNNEVTNIFLKNENKMSVHNISMNAVLCSSLNLDNIYKYFSNCIYNPREFKCMRIDVPVSLNTVHKYIKYLNNKKERQNDDISKMKNEQENETIHSNNYIKEENITTESNNLNDNKLSDSNNSLSGKILTDNKSDENSINISKNKSNIDDNNSDNKNIDIIYDMETMDAFNESEHTMNKKLIINVSIFSNGKIICTGNNSIEACKVAMKKIEKKLKQLNFKNIKLKKITITNILAVYNVGFSIVLPLFAQYYKSVDYDPNVFPACKVKIALMNDDNKSNDNNEHNDNNYAWCNAKNTIDKDKSKVDIVSASIFSTGNITLTGGKSYENLQKCINILLPYLIKSKSQH
ncbi:transcription initiation TFIID-like, putative [Plasmodium sp. gorilla clade G2]|uniref:transcription initiation TFIID-like, putative n=1 Tax=Plasmodium sp. gorilla clade G2 TaxID=880535 RepID=UPI000D21D9F5|nr:transcription initiation TFIID-like, putative [Plasmodium sp. gorilla clade G2]SOV19058.1 transcription initiation TFIID-like, putative [Plasmodium sp. gorilla clade G2]